MDVVVGTGALVAGAVLAATAATGILGVLVVAGVTLPLVGSTLVLCYGLFRDVKYGVGSTSRDKFD